jgi:hypothetical protein
MNTSFLRNVLLPVAVLTAIYAFAIWGLIALYRALRLPRRGAIFLGFVTFGLATGLLTAWIWPLDSSVYLSVYAAWLGDAVYGLAAQRLGDPWILRVPQIYVVVSTILYGALGLLAQRVYKHTAAEGKSTANPV